MPGGSEYRGVRDTGGLEMPGGSEFRGVRDTGGSAYSRYGGVRGGGARWEIRWGTRDSGGFGIPGVRDTGGSAYRGARDTGGTRYRRFETSSVKLQTDPSTRLGTRPHVRNNRKFEISRGLRLRYSTLFFFQRAW